MNTLVATRSPDAKPAAPRALNWPKWPVFEADERKAVEAVLRSGRVNYWTGEEARLFEREYADYVGVPHAVAVANGTLAIELALYALGVGPGDEVIVPSRTFIATASAVVARGAYPIVADIDPISQNITADTIAPLITDKTRAIIPVHLAGWPCDMDPIMALAKHHDIWVIEDCAQAHGARYKGRPIGGIGHVGAFSFCQDKIITTGGEGGMLVTADENVRARAWSYKDHGKSEQKMKDTSAGGSFRLVHDSFGSNWRLTEMQAAIGRRQLAKLDDWIDRRRRNAEILTDYLRPWLDVPLPSGDVEHSYYKLYAFVGPERFRAGWDRDRLRAEIAKAGARCFTGSSPEIYLEDAFVVAGMAPAERRPVARDLGDRSLLFEVHPTLSKWHMRRIGSIAASVLTRAMQR